MAIDWDRAELQLSRWVHVRCEPGWRLDARWSSNLKDQDFWYVWAGRGRMRLRDRTVPLRPGVAIWARPGGLYLADQDPNDRLGVTAIHFELVDRANGEPIDRRELPGEVHTWADAHYVEALTRRITRLAPRGAESLDAVAGGVGNRRAVACALMRALLMDAEARASGEGRADGPAVSSVDRVRRDRFLRLAGDAAADPGGVGTIGDWAESQGCSPDHFTRLFQRYNGRSPRAFLIECRVNRARELLTETPMPIASIARALGYRDVFFFSRQFKQHTGCSPGRYRRTPSLGP